jgi:hypothetical protein
VSCAQEVPDKVDNIYKYFSLFDHVDRNDLPSIKLEENTNQKTFISNCKKILADKALEIEISKFKTRESNIQSQQIEPYLYSRMNVAIDSIKIQMNSAEVYVKSERRGDFDKQLIQILTEEEKEEIKAIYRKEKELFDMGYSYDGKGLYPRFETNEIYRIEFDKENKIIIINNEILRHYFFHYDPIKYMKH